MSTGPAFDFDLILEAHTLCRHSGIGEPDAGHCELCDSPGGLHDGWPCETVRLVREYQRITTGFNIPGSVTQ